MGMLTMPLSIEGSQFDVRATDIRHAATTALAKRGKEPSSVRYGGSHACAHLHHVILGPDRRRRSHRSEELREGVISQGRVPLVINVAPAGPHIGGVEYGVNGVILRGCRRAATAAGMQYVPDLHTGNPCSDNLEAAASVCAYKQSGADSNMPGCTLRHDHMGDLATPLSSWSHLCFGRSCNCTFLSYIRW